MPVSFLSFMQDGHLPCAVFVEIRNLNHVFIPVKWQKNQAISTAKCMQTLMMNDLAYTKLTMRNKVLYGPIKKAYGKIRKPLG